MLSDEELLLLLADWLDSMSLSLLAERALLEHFLGAQKGGEG